MSAINKPLTTTSASESFKGKDRTYYIAPWTNLGSTMYSAALYYCKKRDKHFCLSDGHMSKESLIEAWKDREWIKTNGLLEPSGKFHPCFYAQHLQLVSYLFPDKEVDDWEPLVNRRNWLHLSDGCWSWCNKVSRKQLDIMEDFAEKYKCSLPSWWAQREEFVL